MSEDKPKKLFFSILSGEFYQVEEDEIANLDSYQIPFKHRPKQSCKKCYGRGYISHNITYNVYQLCPKCARACIDFDNFKNRNIEILKHAK